LIPILAEAAVLANGKNIPVSSRPKNWGGYSVGLEDFSLQISGKGSSDMIEWEY
jgi:hypothetical protein